MDLLEYLRKTTSDDEQLPDIEGYVGAKHELSDGKGNILEQTDTRDIFKEKSAKIRDLKQAAFEEAMIEAPIIDQINAAAGRLPAAEVATINGKIGDIRTRYKTKKQAILDAMSLEELENISWEN